MTPVPTFITDKGVRHIVAALTKGGHSASFTVTSLCVGLAGVARVEFFHEPTCDKCIRELALRDVIRRTNEMCR